MKIEGDKREPDSGARPPEGPSTRPEISGLQKLSDNLDAALSSSDREVLLRGLHLIHALAAHPEEAPQGECLAVDERSGKVYLVTAEQAPLIDGELLRPIPPGDETLRLLVRYMEPMAQIFNSHRSDYHTDRSVSWQALHNLWHLREHGGREVAHNLIQIDIDNISALEL